MLIFLMLMPLVALLVLRRGEAVFCTRVWTRVGTLSRETCLRGLGLFGTPRSDSTERRAASRCSLLELGPRPPACAVVGDVTSPSSPRGKAAERHRNSHGAHLLATAVCLHRQSRAMHPVDPVNALAWNPQGHCPDQRLIRAGWRVCQRVTEAEPGIAEANAWVRC